MVKFGKKVVKYRIPILIASILLLVPAAVSYTHLEITDILSDAQFFVVTGQMTPKEACAYICEQGGDS